MERGLSHMVFLFVPKNEGQIQFRMSDEIPGLQYHFVGHPRLFDYAHKHYSGHHTKSPCPAFSAHCDRDRDEHSSIKGRKSRVTILDNMGF